MSQNGLRIDTAHNYNLRSPDATFGLASVGGQVHRLIVWRANGAKDRLRIGETLQRPGEPAFPWGEIRYLRISEDVVFPIYAVAEHQAREWIIEVRYDGGGESVLYSFQDKEQALGFQSMVTGYDVVEYYENTSIQITHRRHKNPVRNAFRARANPQLENRGEVQLWKRKPTATESCPPLPVGSPGTLTSSGTGTHAQRQQRLSDNLSLCTDATTGQQFYLASRVPKPVLVMFFKNDKGGYTMMRTDIPPLRSTLMPRSLILQPKDDAAFSVKQLEVTSTALSRWNVCAIGAFSKTSALETLTATSLILAPSLDNLGLLDVAILNLRLEFGRGVLENDRAKRDVRNNAEPEAAYAAKNASMWSPGSSSSGSTVGAEYRPLSIRTSFESLAGMIGRDRMSAEARTSQSQSRRPRTMVTEAAELEPNVPVTRTAELESRSSRTLLPTNAFR